jgi:hypothetical protein
MAELPGSWGLKTVPRQDGKLDIIGNDDAGNPYRVRTTDGPQVTETDVRELRDADREQYQQGEAGVKEAVRRLVGEEAKPMTVMEQMQAAATFDESEWISAAEPIVHAGFERKGSTVGSTWTYRRGFERIFGGN